MIYESSITDDARARAEAIVDDLSAHYARSVAALRDALRRHLETGARPDLAERAAGEFSYPELRLIYAQPEQAPRRWR